MVENPSYYPTIELIISCRGLKDIEYFSKTDPMVQVLEKNSKGNNWRDMGHTEIVWDSLNPDFLKHFLVDYHFEEMKYLKFVLYDGEDKAGSLKDARYIGEAECTLADVLTNQGQQLIRTLYNQKPESNDKESQGNIIIRAEETETSKEKAELSIKAFKLKKTCCNLNFKPFFYIYRVMESGANVKVYKSDPSSGRNPSWKTLTIGMGDLCRNDYECPLGIEIYDHYITGNHRLLGTGEFKFREIANTGQLNIDLQSNRQKVGEVEIKCLKVAKVNTFIDYISGGCTLNLIAAIDFTLSNMNPHRPDSLHYLNPNGQNDYEKAISSVGEILLKYDSDKMVPFYGFGGKVGGTNSDCFALNFDQANPNVYELDGLMTTYRNALQIVELSGPTHFSGVINTAIAEVEEADVSYENQQYFILLIITDGMINDMQSTIDAIVKASFLPLSIVIVGLGNQDFSKMQYLDADDFELVDSHGRKMKRDIVQFVPFIEVGNSPTALAKEVLEEIPREIVNYFSMNNIEPKVAPPPLQPDLPANNYPFQEHHDHESEEELYAPYMVPNQI